MVQEKDSESPMLTCFRPLNPIMKLDRLPTVIMEDVPEDLNSFCDVLLYLILSHVVARYRYSKAVEKGSGQLQTRHLLTLNQVFWCNECSRDLSMNDE